MKKTYVTEMPDRVGAFLQAGRIFADLNVNITRVSYNKALDSHMLFIEAEGSREQLEDADRRLGEIGYLPQNTETPRIILIEFKLRDVPGAVTGVLELIERYGFNISYLSSQENGTDYQLFKMGLFVEDEGQIEDFLLHARELWSVRVVDYDPSERTFDNSIFYRSFIAGLAAGVELDEGERQTLLVNANLAMQTLDERGLSPYRTFDSIHGFAELLGACAGEAFHPRISRHAAGESEIISIEPDCGSNTFLLQSRGKTLFIDSGYACYRREMESLFRTLLPDYDGMEKEILITHADVDHCGLLPRFDRVYASAKSAASLEREYEGADGLREQNPLHKPYITMCKVLTKYQSVDPRKLTVPWEDKTVDSALTWIGAFAFGEFAFEVYEGAGGHLPGEIVLLDREHRVVFTGDIFVNLKDMTPAQKRYNTFAPILMTSVDTDPALCAREREALYELLGEGEWRLFAAHGAVKKLEMH